MGQAVFHERAEICVATVSEGAELRSAGIRGDILILVYTAPEDFALLKKHDLIQTIVDAQYAGLLNSFGQRIRAHLKIDTGMRRLGERSEHIKQIAALFQCRNLAIDGAYTHLCADDSTSERDRAFTGTQANAFYDAICELKKRGCSCGKTHLLASCGLLNYPELGGDYARTGIALYGLLSDRSDLKSCPAGLKPVLSLKARIASVKELCAGETAGYGADYIAKCDRRIAVLTIGYADGLPRALSNGKGSVLLNGRCVPIVGRICMDQTIVDVTDIPDVKQGDIAVVIGRSDEKEITAYDIAEQSGTITNEILSCLGNRLNRIILQ